jgi:hypothetical protein
LNRQEAFRHAAGGDLGRQELGHVLPDFVGHRRRFGECAGFVISGGLDRSAPR